MSDPVDPLYEREFVLDRLDKKGGASHARDLGHDKNIFTSTFAHDFSQITIRSLATSLGAGRHSCCLFILPHDEIYRRDFPSLVRRQWRKKPFGATCARASTRSS